MDSNIADSILYDIYILLSFVSNKLNKSYTDNPLDFNPASGYSVKSLTELVKPADELNYDSASRRRKLPELFENSAVEAEQAVFSLVIARGLNSYWFNRNSIAEDVFGLTAVPRMALRQRVFCSLVVCRESSPRSICGVPCLGEAEGRTPNRVLVRCIMSRSLHEKNDSQVFDSKGLSKSGFLDIEPKRGDESKPSRAVGDQAERLAPTTSGNNPRLAANESDLSADTVAATGRLRRVQYLLNSDAASNPQVLRAGDSGASSGSSKGCKVDKRAKSKQEAIMIPLQPWLKSLKKAFEWVELIPPRPETEKAWQRARGAILSIIEDGNWLISHEHYGRAAARSGEAAKRNGLPSEGKSLKRSKPELDVGQREPVKALLEGKKRAPFSKVDCLGDSKRGQLSPGFLEKIAFLSSAYCRFPDNLSRFTSSKFQITTLNDCARFFSGFANFKLFRLLVYRFCK